MRVQTCTTCTVVAAVPPETTVASAANEVVERAAARRGGYACLCNVHMLVAARGNAALAMALADAWRIYPDGAPVAWLKRRFGSGAARRIAGAELMLGVLDAGREHGLRHALFGSNADTLARLRHAIERDHSGASIVAAVAPPVASVDNLGGTWLRAIIDADPDVVWVALGAPKQELWMRRYAVEIPDAVLLGVGAAFDFVAGEKRRAPLWMQRLSLEWIHRLTCEPTRLAKRYLITNTLFLMRAPLEIVHAHQVKRRSRSTARPYKRP